MNGVLYNAASRQETIVEPVPADIDSLLQQVTEGDEEVRRDLFAAVYGELRALAGAAFRGQAASHTLQPTALANEAYLRLTDRSGLEFSNRAQFFGLASIVMRGILTDHIRKHRTAKRGGDWQRVTLSGLPDSDAEEALDLIALDDALTELSKVSPRQSRLVEYRFFGGLSVPEAAELLGVSRSTAEDDWRIARAWLAVQLEGDAIS